MKYALIPIFILAATACTSGKTEPTDTDVPSASDTEPDTESGTDTESDTEEPGDCDVDGTAYTEATEIYAGSFIASVFGSDGYSEVITTEARLAEVMAEEDFTIEAVDFDTYQVLIGTSYVSSTCELQLDGYTVVEDDDGTVHLSVDTTDTTGACKSSCDAGGHIGVMVQVPREVEAEVCVDREDVCLK